MTSPDFAPVTLRRVALIQERMETLYSALHIALILVFVGVLCALYTMRSDILEAIERSKP